MFTLRVYYIIVSNIFPFFNLPLGLTSVLQIISSDNTRGFKSKYRPKQNEGVREPENVGAREASFELDQSRVGIIQAFSSSVTQPTTYVKHLVRYFVKLDVRWSKIVN